MKFKFPLPGQRIFRTMIAVWLCMLIYYLRGQSGLPFMAAVAAIQCIQPDTKNMRTLGKDRIVGTLVGTVWGALMLYAEYLTVGPGQLAEAVRFVLAGACAGAVIYSTVLLGIGERAFFSSVVFLSIVMNHALDADPSIFIIDRFLDTVLGIIVGSLVNSIHLPRLRDKKTLFVAGIAQVAPGQKHKLPRYTKVELNRLIEDGANFTVVTRQSPATLREVMDGVKLKCPVVVMNATALYDMESRHYLYAEWVDEDVADGINALFKEEQPQHFIITLEDDLLVINYHKMVEGTMKHRYLARRKSIYRNYVHTVRDIREHVLYYLAMGTVEEMHRLAELMKQQPWADRCRFEFDDFDCGEDELLLRITSSEATRKQMVGLVAEDLEVERIVKFGKDDEGYDEVVPLYGDAMAREMKRRFEPVDIRGWRNILRW